MCNGCDPPEFYDIKTRTARKEHECGECHEAIAPGQKYIYWKGRFWNGFLDFKLCLRCDGDWRLLTDAIDEEEFDMCIHYGKFQDQLEEALNGGGIEADDLAEDDPLRELIERWLPHFYDLGESQQDIPESWCLEENRQLHFSFAFS
ncbi:MAG: hypothetical protein HYW15_03605 [Candidatus Giovannonibacteria bacterium]|nr:MAG: hypothetical protein HYW15_03605 [Candidatus Giovannonibacteria bacterium]